MEDLNEIAIYARVVEKKSFSPPTSTEERPRHPRRDRSRHDPDVGVMDHGEDVLAFGAHTPGFLQGEPYVADAAEQKAS